MINYLLYETEMIWQNWIYQNCSATAIGSVLFVINVVTITCTYNIGHLSLVSISYEGWRGRRTVQQQREVELGAAVGPTFLLNSRFF